MVLAEPVKVGVLQRVMRAQALRRVHDQQAFHERQGLLRQLADVALFERLGARHVRELEPEEAGIPQKHLGLVGGQGPHHLLNHIKLIDFAFARKQRLPVSELAHDAPDRPHVHALAVASVAQQQLWSPVPARGHVVG